MELNLIDVYIANLALITVIFMLRGVTVVSVRE